MQRIHIIGGTGSGKTTLARKLGTRLGVPFYDLDEVGYEGGFGAKRPLDVRLAALKRITAQSAWVTEGGFILWIDELLHAADTIVWLDLPWRVRRWHIIMNRATVVHTLEQYKNKVVHCRTVTDVAAFEKAVTPG